MTKNILDGFDELSDRIEAGRRTEMLAAYTGAKQVPEAAARANTLSDQLGQPYGVVAANLEDFEDDARRREITEAGDLSPHVAEFLSDPRRMALASDEAPKLANFANTLAEPAKKDWADELLSSVVTTGVGIYSNVRRAATGQVRTEDVRDTGDGLRSIPAGAVRGIAMAVGGIGEGYNVAERTLDRGVGAAGVVGEVAGQRGDIPIYLRPGDSFIGSGQYLKQLADWIAPPTERQSFGTQVAEGVGQAGPMILQALYAPQTLSTSTLGMGFDQMATAVRSKGAYGTGKGDAAIAAGGVVIGGLERLGIERLVERLPPTLRSATYRYLTDISIAAATEAATEAGQEVAQNSAIQALIDPSQSLTEGVADSAAVGGAVGGIIRTALGLPRMPRSQTRRAAEELSRIVRSTDGNEQLRAATELAAQLQLGARSPEDMKALTAAVGGEDAHVYLDADKAQTLFQSSPQLLAELVGGADVLAEQLAVGQVAVPLPEWMATVSRLPNRDELLKHARRAPDQMTPAELETLDVVEIARGLGMDTSAAAPRDTDTDASRSKVQQDVMAQLVGTERYTPAQAEGQARLWGAVFGRLGEVTGQDPVALYERYVGGIEATDAPVDVAETQPHTLKQRGIDAPGGPFGRPQVSTDARGQQTIEHEGRTYVQRAGQWLLTDSQGQAKDFFTLDLARTEAEPVDGEIVQDDAVEGQRQTWSVALPETTAREILAGDILFQGPAAGDVLQSEGFKEWFGDRSVEQLEADYAAIPATDGGRRIDTDLVRELAPAYVADRTLSGQLHPYASRLTKELFKRALERPVAEGRYPIVQFLAGGGGSGKSTATAHAVAAGNADIIFDGTLSNLDNARRDIEAALGSDRGVRVDFVYRSPEKSVEGAIGRAIKAGRPVPVWALAEAHSGAPRAVKALAKEYDGNSRVLIAATWNDGEFGQHRPMSVEEIPDVDREQAEQTFRTAVDQAFAEGRASVGLRDAFNAGRSGAQDLGSVREGGPEQPAGNAVTEQTPPSGGVSGSEGAKYLQQTAAPRGQIRVGLDRSMQISLFKGADLSTFLHESGHFFLEVYRDLAVADGAQPALRADFDAVLKWLGVESADQIGVDQHEQFARGFEAYLGEGKAPTTELQSVFSQFKQWMLGIYRSLRNLDVQLTDEVRGVFDRMLASEEEIEAAQARVGWQPLAGNLKEAAALGMTEKQFADYQADVITSRDQAAADIERQLAEADARARERWWKDELSQIRAEVSKEVEATPIVRAFRILSGRKHAAGELVPAELFGLKLDREALVSVYGDGLLDKLGRVYARNGGIDPDLAAAMLGLKSGDELVQGLWTAKQVLAGVNAEADARMHARHGEPMTDGTLPQRAADAIHNSRRVQLLEKEMGILAALAGEQRPSRQQLKAVAEALISAKTTRQLRPNDYLVAERRAARQSAESAAQGKYGDALLAKRRQALNASLYSEARRGLERAGATTEFLRKAASDKTRTRVGKQGGKSYVEALDAIFAGHEMQGVSARQIGRRASLRDWVRRVQEEGANTAVSEALLARVEAENVTNIADISLTELEKMREAVGNILHLSRLKDQLQTIQGKRTWDEVKAGVTSRLSEQRASHVRSGISEADRTLFRQAADAYASGANWLLQPETLVEWLDGGASGPLHDVLWEPSEQAENHRNDMKRRVGSLLQQAISALPASDRKALDRLHEINSMDDRVSGHSILSALLNMGNAGNRDKLGRGGRIVGDRIVEITDTQLAEMFSKLTAPQATMVQGIWDAVDSLWPDIVAMEERLNGIAPERVEAQAFTVITRDGAVPLRGGYFPATYDPMGAQAAQFSEDEHARRVLSGQMGVRASTSKGHTESRTDYVAPLLLDWNAVLTTHLDGVIGDIAYRQFLTQATRVLRDADIRRMIDGRVGKGATKGLLGAFERGATGAFFPQGMGTDPLMRLTNKTMVNASVAALGFRVPLALANIVTAPMLATARISPKWLARGFTDYYRSMRANIEAIHTVSPMMLKRSEARSAEYSALLDTLRGKRGLKAQMVELSMTVHQWIVPLAENAIWLSAYKQAQADGQGVAEAGRRADKLIRQTQTKHSLKDLSTAESNPYMKPLMMFAGPLVVINNRLQEAGLRGNRGVVKTPIQALGVWLAMAAGGAWVFELIMGRGPEDEDDDGDEDLADWARWAAVKLGLLPFSGIPGVRDAVSYLDKGYVTGSHPLVAATQRLVRFGQKAADEDDGLFADDPEGYEIAQAGLGAASVFVPIPSNQIKKTGDYLMEVGTGEHTPSNPAADAYYLLQGPPKEKK